MENDCIAPEGFTSSVGQLLSGEEELARSAGGSQILFSPAGIRGHLARRGAQSAHWLGAGDACRRPNVGNVIYEGDWVRRQNIAHEIEANKQITLRLLCNT